MEEKTMSCLYLLYYKPVATWESREEVPGISSYEETYYKNKLKYILKTKLADTESAEQADVEQQLEQLKQQKREEKQSRQRELKRLRQYKENRKRKRLEEKLEKKRRQARKLRQLGRLQRLQRLQELERQENLQKQHEREIQQQGRLQRQQQRDEKLKQQQQKACEESNEESSHEETYSCRRCGKTFSSSLTAQNHERYCQVTFLCEGCNGSYSYMQFNKHRKTCRPYQCHLCKNKFKFEQSIMKHIMFKCPTLHPKSETNQQRRTCGKCGLTFPYITYLKHMCYDSMTKTYTCSVCEEVLKCKSLIKMHLCAGKKVDDE